MSEILPLDLASPLPDAKAGASGITRLPETALPPECALLLVCLRWPVAREARELIVTRSLQRLDWALFMALVHRHRVAGLVAHALREAGVTLPPGYLAMLRDVAAKLAWSELMLAQELKTLQAELHVSGIRPIILKGLGLSKRAYGGLGFRFNRDIDLLVDRAQVPHVCAVLEARGYQRLEPGPQVNPREWQRWLRRQKDIVYFQPDRQQTVEVHWRLFDNPHLLPFADTGARAQVKLAPGFEIETLPVRLDFIFICVHGAHHAWSRLKWLADLAALAATMRPQDLSEIYVKSHELGVHRAVAQALLLCARLFALAIPESAVADAASDWRIRALYAVAHRALFSHGAAEIEEIPLGSTAKNATHYLLSDSLRYRFNELLFDLTDLTGEGPRQGPAVLRPLVRPILWMVRQARMRSHRKN